MTRWQSDTGLVRTGFPGIHGVIDQVTVRFGRPVVVPDYQRLHSAPDQGQVTIDIDSESCTLLIVAVPIPDDGDIPSGIGYVLHREVVLRIRNQGIDHDCVGQLLERMRSLKLNDCSLSYGS